MADARTISVRKDLFQVRLWTAGQGAPLLYLHGWQGLLEWPAWLDGLTPRYRVFAPQHPGYGDSTGLEQLDDFIDLSLYYFELLETLGIERPVIIGHSLGANIAAEMAALSPPSVGKLVLIAPTGFWDDKHPVADIFAMTPSERERSLWHSYDDAKARGLSTVPKTDDEKRTDMLERTRSLSTAAKFLFPIPDKGLKKRAYRIKAPTLLVWGASDKVVPPSYGKLFQAALGGGAQLVEVPQAGHQILVEQPAKVLAAVKGFLDPRW